MESKKQSTEKKEVTTNKKNTTKSTTNKKKSVNKNTSSKKTVSKKASTNKNLKDKTSTNKKSQNKPIKNNVNNKTIVTEEVKVKSVELANVLEEKNETVPLKHSKKDKKLLAIGVFIVILGIAALLVSLVANRIIDREFLDDSSITLMMAISIIIEGLGSFIIINES